MNAMEMIKERETKFKSTLEAISKVQNECEFLKKCITYGVDTRTRHCVTQQFVDNRLEIIKAKLNTISSKFCYEYNIDDIIDGICEITKEILKWLQEA